MNGTAPEVDSSASTSQVSARPASARLRAVASVFRWTRLLVCVLPGFVGCQGDPEAVAEGPSEQFCRALAVCEAAGVGGAAGQAGAFANEECSLLSELLAFEHLQLPSYRSSADFAFLPAPGEMLVAERRGVLRHVRVFESSVQALAELTVPDQVYDESACGLTNVLVDPLFEQNHFLYLSYCTSTTNTRLVRVTWEAERLRDLQVIFETGLEKRKDEWHRFGSMGFEQDGETLWLLVGEHTLPATAQDLTTPLGSLVRIVPSREPGVGGYTIPGGNLRQAIESGLELPTGVVDLAEIDVHPAIFASGLRSPWRGTRDERGRVFVGDVGNAQAEEVNLVTEVGQNFGWPTWEGTCSEEACPGLVNPLVEYDRSADHPYVFDDVDTEPATKRAIWVGQIYEGVGQDRYCGQLSQLVPFGDYFTGWVRALAVSSSGALIQDVPLGHLPSITSWKLGTDGFAYALTMEGDLARLRLVGSD